MDWNEKEPNQVKTLFKTIYCWDCKQVKICGKVSLEYCCRCSYQIEQEKAREYSSYQQVYQRKSKEYKEHIQQLKLLREYSGCKNCQSKEVDAYFLYENSKLVCQPCRMKKEGGASGSVNFLERRKWFKRYWKIDLVEWLEKYGCLPVNADCAKKWQNDKEHLLNNCRCLEIEAQESYLLFANSLRKKEEQLKDCQCESSPKVRVDYIDSEGSGWTYCQICEKRIESAGHHGIIKNRNNPSFWGLNVKEKTLCLECLGKLVERMPVSKKYTFNKYLKRGY